MKTFKHNWYKCLALIALLAITGCDVVELDTPGPQEDVASPVGLPDSAAELNSILTNDQGREWEALTFSLEGLEGFQACRLDDSFSFFDDGTYQYDGGEVLCGGADDRRLKSGTWKTDFENLEIIFDETTDLESTARILGIEDNRMELSGTVDIFGQNLAIKGIYQFN